MRQTASVALLLGVLLGVGVSGVAVSATAPALAPSPWPAAPDPVLAAAGAGAPERVGTIEQVDAMVGYQPGEQSVTFHYPGADYVKVHLRQVRLLPGDYLTIAEPAGVEVHRYESEVLPAAPAGGQWAMSVTGDTVTVTLHQTQPSPGSAPELGVAIDKIARGLLPGEVAAATGPVPFHSDRAESICGRDDSVDATCFQTSYPTIYRNSKAVARLLINGIELCTAFRVGPDNRLLTNHHCVSSSRQARQTEVWFNYQCAECGGWAVFRPTKVRGDQLLDTDQVLDYALFTVDDFAAIERYGHLELADRPAQAGEEIYIPQHPRGLPTRVALSSDRDSGGNCQVADPQAHGYGWHTDIAYYCDTEGGSSGSPVLSRDRHQVIALHHLGGCPNGGVRMDLIQPRIAGLI